MKLAFFRSEASHLAALWLVGGLICLLRSPLVFLHPIAGWEDGTQGINIYGRAGAPLFHMYSGYVQAWPNLIFRLVMFVVPLPYVPYAFGLVALAITAAIVPAAYKFIQNVLQIDRAAAGVCAIVIGIIPTGDWMMMANVDFAIWPIAASLIFCLWNPLPDHIVGRFGYVSWRALSVATNPLTLPVALVWAVFLLRAKRQGDRWVWALLIAAALVYAVFGIEHRPGASSTLGMVCAQALRLATQSSLLALLPGARWWGSWPKLWLLAAVFAATLTLIAAVRRRPVEIVIFCIGLVAMCIISALGRGVQHEPTYLIYYTRYAYVERLLWCCMIAAAMCDLWTRHPAPPVRLAIFVACGLLVAMQLIGLASPYAWNDVATSDRLLDFLARSSEKLRAGEQGPFTLDRGEWSIVVGGPGAKGQ